MNHRNLIVLILLIASPVAILAKPGTEEKVAPSRPQGPCDIYGAAGTPCVAAHSTTRALYAAYTGPLYQVMRQSDGKTMDIGIIQPSENDPGGYADAAAQDAFCANDLCYISKIYDQSEKGNHLVQAPPGTFKGPARGAFNHLPIADMAPVTISGHKAYGVYIIPGMGLRNNDARDLAINDEPEGIYYVINGKHFSSGCCFDYGNSSTNSRAVGTGTMETTYYGTATAWGSGNGPGPWIMADMEAGLFSGYNAKKNDVPSIDSWQFVSAFVDGGGGNKWDLRGGNAQQGGLTTYYSGPRPGTPASDAYYPMNKKGGILLGNGGDNGNGSAGTFYEGVMTTGYPTEATTDAVQANIVAARYDVPRLGLSRVTTFTPKSVQEVNLSFTNTSNTPATGVKLSLSAPNGWTTTASGSMNGTRTFQAPVAPNATVSAAFKLQSPQAADAGFLVGKVEWSNASNGLQSETISQRVRNAPPVKINEVRLGTGQIPTDQFIELYNASTNVVDISNWSIINTQAQWAPVKLGTIPTGTRLKPGGFYLLGLSPTGLIAPASPGDKTLYVLSTSGLAAGQQINVGGEAQQIANVGTGATTKTTLFIPVSKDSWLNFPAGANNLPVTSADGFATGQKIGIGLGNQYEVATVSAVGKAATQTNLAAAAKAGDPSIKVYDNADMSAGDSITINTGTRAEIAIVKSIPKVSIPAIRGRSAGEAGEVELTVPLKLDHMTGVDVYGRGTGVSFSPATRFIHSSGEAIQALGSGITLANNLASGHPVGEPITMQGKLPTGYQDSHKPDQWFGYPLSITAGSLALMDASGKVLVDGVVFGSQQTNSSANGWVSSPEIATLEGVQSQGGCMAVSPTAVRNGVAISAPNDYSNRSIGLFPDGADTDNNCTDFYSQNATSLVTAVKAGSNNIKIAGTEGLQAGQEITVGTGPDSETAVITTVGTPGGTSLHAATTVGVTVIPVASVMGFRNGQTITIGSGADIETAVISSIAAMRRFGSQNSSTDSITVTTPLKHAHAADAPVSGSGITLNKPLKNSHDVHAQVAGYLPTPGAPNKFSVKSK